MKKAQCNARGMADLFGLLEHDTQRSLGRGIGALRSDAAFRVAAQIHLPACCGCVLALEPAKQRLNGKDCANALLKQILQRVGGRRVLALLEPGSARLPLQQCDLRA